jgi:hypothetical protein
MFMPRAAPTMMNMGFGVAPSGAGLEGSTTKAIFVVNLIAKSEGFKMKVTGAFFTLLTPIGSFISIKLEAP